MTRAVASNVTPIHETLRIAGEKTDRDERIEVFNPWDNSIVGTVPSAHPEDVVRAFDIAASYTPTLTRYERQQILVRTAEILTSRREVISDL
ncbi:MAG: aldehyde dehydrogenase family protein, partial [Arenicellales bacterium]